MNFIAHVEEHLRDLGSEARKKHPGVKEASERAILTLRSLQSRYVSAVRSSASGSIGGMAAVPHPDTSLFRSQDVLRPFLLACNYPDANVKLLNIGLDAIQLLLSGDAVCPEDSIHIVRVLVIQASVCSSFELGSSSSIMVHSHHSMSGSSKSARKETENEALCIKILQTLTIIAASRELHFGEEVLSQTLTVCLIMTSSRHPPSKTSSALHYSGMGSRGSQGVGGGVKLMGLGGGSRTDTIPSNVKIRRAAATTLKQILSLLFDRAEAQIHEQYNKSSIGTNGKSHSVSSVQSRKGENKQNSSKIFPDSRTCAVRAASNAFLDLCNLAEMRTDIDHTVGLNHKNDITGPFSLGGITGHGLHRGSMGSKGGDQKKKRIQMPPQSACFELLDMIITQHPELFLASNSSKKETSGNVMEIEKLEQCNKSEVGVVEESGNIGFSNLLHCNACPLVTTSLLTEYTSTFDKRNINGAGKDNLNSDDLGEGSFEVKAPDVKMSKSHFCLLTRSTKLASTIVNMYGKKKDLGGEVHILLMSLVRFISASTDASHSADNFEDGFCYSSSFAHHQSKEESLNQAGGNTIWRPSNSSETDNRLRTQIIPNTLMWRAALSLESIYYITSNPVMLKFLHASHDSQQNNATIVAVISEVVSDFATIAASNQSSVLDVVSAAARHEFFTIESNQPSLKPNIFSSARNFTKTYDDWESSHEKQPLPNSSSNNDTKPASFTYFVDYTDMNIPCVDGGEAIWVAFHCTVSLVRSLLHLVKEYTDGKDKSDDSELRSLVDCCFAPSLAVLQHFLKRFPGSAMITQHTLLGYECLANASIPLNREVQRKAILHSLCKLSLPGMAKADSTVQLHDHHIQSIATLLLIVHRNYDNIDSDWRIILNTLENLSSLSISSSKLSDQFYRIALSISSVFTRISKFTSCLSDKSLESFVKALIAISLKTSVKKSSITLPDGDDTIALTVQQENSEESSVMTYGSKETIGVKLMSFSGRLFGGGSTISENETSVHIPISRVPPSKTYMEDLSLAVFTNLAATKLTTKKDVFHTLPFCLIALTDVTLTNSLRFSTCGGHMVIAHLCELAATSNSPEVRSYAMDTLAILITFRLSGSTISDQFVGIKSTIRPNPISPDDYLAVDPVLSGDQQLDSSTECYGQPQSTAQAELLTPLCDTVAMTDQRDTAESGLNALHVILEGAGHNLEGNAWPILISAIAALSGDSGHATALVINRSTSAWLPCGTLAFRCLKLIIDDFLDQLPSHPDPFSEETRAALLDCCASFGSSTYDVNTSLTATGMLWTIADQDPTPSSLDRVLSKLALLASDNRAEVRNCSVNTLFSCVVGLGHRFTAEQWRICLGGTLFGVLDRVSLQLASGVNSAVIDHGTKATKSSRYKVTVHHSRDSERKQWATTQILTLRGLERVLRQFFSKLLATTSGSTEILCDNDLLPNTARNKGEPDTYMVSWFESAWRRIVAVAYKCATEVGGRETLELRLAGVDMLMLCTQVSSKRGIIASTTNVRVGTNMQVVNGALRSVRAAYITEPPIESISMSLLQGKGRLFCAAFEVLEKFTGHFNEPDEEEDERFVMCGGSTNLQVLTRIAQGLAKIYECCKENEMSPAPPTSLTYFAKKQSADQNVKQDLESRMVMLVTHIAEKSVGDPSARYLNQAQRSCLELFRKMTANSSSRALEALSVLGRRSFFMKHNINNTTDDDETEDDASISTYEILEREAAKAVADSFKDSSVPDIAKITVLILVLESFLELSSSQLDREYSLLVPLVKSGLDLASDLEAKTVDSNSSGGEVNVWRLLIEDVWDRMISAVSILVSPLDNTFYTFYTPHTENILELVSYTIQFSPERTFPSIAIILSQGARSSIECARLHCNENNEYPRNQTYDSVHHCRDALQIFSTCFDGLCKCEPQGHNLHEISEQVMEEAFKSVGKINSIDGYTESVISQNTLYGMDRDKTEMIQKINVEVEVAMIVCDSISNGSPNLKQLVVALFSWLCKLTNVKNGLLREKAGAVLGCVDLASVMAENIEERVKAEKRAEMANERILELEDEVDALRDDLDNMQKEMTGLNVTEFLN